MSFGHNVRENSFFTIQRLISVSMMINEIGIDRVARVDRMILETHRLTSLTGAN